MRKSLLVAFALLFAAAICAVDVYAASEEPVVVVTISPLYMVVKEVAGSEAEVYVLAPAGVDPHSYSPTPQDVALVSSCDLFVCVGKEEFLGQLPSPQHGLVLSWEDWLSYGVYVENGNPHYLWLYPPNVKVMADAVADALSKLNPSCSSYYRANAESLKREIDELKDWVDVVTSSFKGESVVLAGDHFEPLVKWIGLNVSYIVIRGQGGIPGPQTLKEAIEAAKSSRLVIISATQSEGYEGIYGERVAGEAGVPAVYLYGIPISQGDTYTEFIKYNVMIIASYTSTSTSNACSEASSQSLDASDIYPLVVSALAVIAVVEGILVVRLR